MTIGEKWKAVLEADAEERVRAAVAGVAADRDRLRAALAKLYGRAVGMEPPTKAELDEAWDALGWSGADHG